MYDAKTTIKSLKETIRAKLARGESFTKEYKMIDEVVKEARQKGFYVKTPSYNEIFRNSPVG